MEKEYHVIDVGFIGSFLEERADNDGDSLRKNLSINVPTNNVYVINPVTGLLERKVGDVNTDNPEFVQFNSDKPTTPTTDLIIKNIGRTIKVINTTKTEICVRETIPGSNYRYFNDSLPVDAETCLKSIYFTSNKGIDWPKLEQTYAVLDDLSKKIPYDIGFSKKYYKLHTLDDLHLRMIEKDTKISYDFLKKLKSLVLIDTEFPEDIEYSEIKLSPEWDGFSVDKNDSNNLVYSDYFKTESADYANIVFLVTDRTLDDLKYYFVSSSFKDNYFQMTNTYNPELSFDQKYKKQENFGNLVFLKPKSALNPAALNSGNINFNLNTGGVTTNTITLTEMFFASEQEILDILNEVEIYRMNLSTTDVELVEEIVASNIFMDIVGTTDLFVLNKITIGEMDSSKYTEIQNITNNTNIIHPLLLEYGSKISKNKMSINNKVFHLIKKYVDFQINNNFPFRLNIRTNMDKFGTLFNGNPFYITDENGLILNSIRLARTIILTYSEETELFFATTASIDVPPISVDFSPMDRLLIDTYNIRSVPSMILKDLNYETDYAQSYTRYITEPIFSNGLERNKNFYTSSAPQNHINYYTQVYTDNPNNVLSKHIFDIAYAHISGSGSSYVSNSMEYLPAKTFYKKYVNECIGNTDYMVFGDNKKSDYFYIIQFNRDTFKDKLDSQNLQISLSPISSNLNQLINTGSNFSTDENIAITYNLIDDSKTLEIFYFSSNDGDEYYNLYEGTQQDGLKYEKSETESWGMIFPNRGLILLNGEILDKYCNFNTVTASIHGENTEKLFVSISSSCAPNSTRNTHEYWYIRSAEKYSDENYFCRVGRNEFNYTNNYTYISGSNRKFFYDKVNNSTKNYITSIGLFGLDETANTTLLAIAKLSKPLLKDSSEEYVFNIKLKSD